MISKEKESLILKKYIFGNSIKKIYKETGISDTAIKRVLLENNIIIRKPVADLNINSNAFSELNEQASYWLGMIATDGSVSRRRKIQNKYYESYSIELGLEYSDLEHIEKFKEFLKSNKKIYYSTKFKPIKANGTTTMAKLIIYNKKLTEDCIGYGITPRKTYTLEIKNDYLLNSKDFWRGVIDGDGSIWFDKNPKGNRKICPRIELASASYSFILQFKKYCEIKINKLNNKITKNARSNNWKYKISGSKCIELIKILYQNSVVYLKRKKTLSENIMSGEYLSNDRKQK